MDLIGFGCGIGTNGFFMGIQLNGLHDNSAHQLERFSTCEI